MHSLTLKLTLAFLVVSLTGVGLVALLVWGITASEFNQFLIDRGQNEFTQAAAAYYEEQGSWVGVNEAIRQQIQVFVPVQEQNDPARQSDPYHQNDPGRQYDPGRPNDGKNSPRSPFALTDAQGQVVVPFGPYHSGDTVPADQLKKGTVVQVNNRTVGYVLNTGGPPMPNPIEIRYQARTNVALILAALGAVIIAVLLGLFLARTITRPVRDLTLASRAVAAGHLNQQVPVRSRDELGELTRTFNKMSADLEQSNHLRRQMTADIAHDLRTPLSVITGYLEGLKDGVIKPSPRRFDAMYDEAVYLQRLVEDLRTLSLADAGELSMNRQPIQLGELIERLAASFQQQAEQNQIQIQTVVDENLPSVSLDPERMQQALSNLVSNAMRYTPPQGLITLTARRADGHLTMEVKDTGSGIAVEALPHIFDRFYRGDDSRQEGGSGLGLAIAKSIVELQGGRISATSAGPGRGSLFTIQFPG